MNILGRRNEFYNLNEVTRIECNIFPGKLFASSRSVFLDQRAQTETTWSL